MRREEKKLDSILVSTMTEIDEDAQELLATKYGAQMGIRSPGISGADTH